MDQSRGQVSAPQLLRKPYACAATKEEREYLLYLPTGYESEPERRWPVLLFLHGGGERGDGRDDLDWVLLHGALGEAWVHRHDLPFIIIGPQLPVFGMHNQVALRAQENKPQRLAEGAPRRSSVSFPPRPPLESGDFPMVRAESTRPPRFGVNDDWGVKGATGGWQNCEAELLGMVDATLRDYRADASRVYLSGLSYGGYGTWYMGTAHPERWAAIAPICGAGNPALAHRLADVQKPVWIFHGGRDEVVLPKWSYEMANALEAAGHRSVRLTVHEDLPHNCWERVYSGEDLYHWLLEFHL